MSDAIEKALATWYPKDHPLHLDLLHPALGLAGEAGELLDLYKKERFKTGYSWWDCVHCSKEKDSHNYNNFNLWCSPYVTIPFIYTPKILDELGDAWYYMRILAYQLGLPVATPLLQSSKPDTIVILSQLNRYASLVLEGSIIDRDKRNKIYHLGQVNYHFFMLLRELDFTLDQVTESNWQKLKDGDNHGWKEARQSPKQP